ncbi:MAG: hypothetical protein WCT12_17240 [Verrucomicrobiota bacterium]
MRLRRPIAREATSLAHRFIAGVTKPARPAAQPETTPAPAAEPVAA